MIGENEYRLMKRAYRRDQRVEPLVKLLESIVGRVARDGRLPPWLSPTGHWDAEARRDALQGWLEKRLLRRGDILAAFDHAASPGPFIAALEKSFRHYLMNAAPASELENLVDRTTAMLRNETDTFSEWEIGHSYWGLVEWRERKLAPEPWAAGDRALVSEAWACGQFDIVRYGPGVSRSSPILSTLDLHEFLIKLFGRCDALLDKSGLRVVLRERFAIDQGGEAVTIDDVDVASRETVEQRLESEDARQIALIVIDEMTPRQAEVLARRQKGETLDQIASALGISRGTVDNEIDRVAKLVRSLKEDIPQEEILEIVLSALSN